MPTPILRQLVGSAITLIGANAIASGGYANAADQMLVDNSTVKAIQGDFELDCTFGAAPVTGAVSLMAVDYSLDGATAGAAPSAALMPRFVGSFNPMPATGNTATSMMLRLSGVPLTGKTAYSIYNNGTGQAILAGYTLRCQMVTPGT
jgi:hypothetical protein